MGPYSLTRARLLLLAALGIAMTVLGVVLAVGPRVAAEGLFGFLFKYRPLLYRQGELAFAAAWPTWLLALLALAGIGVAYATYRSVQRASARDRAILVGLRVAIFLLLVGLLARPMLVLSQVQPQQNFLGILLDDSRSMQIDDGQPQSRAAYVGEWFGPESPLHRSLADRFSLRFFRFASATDRIGALDELTFAGTRTELGQALTRARDELTGVPLSGLVVVTDGADTAPGGLPDSLLDLQAAGVPVYPIGVGREQFERDIQLSRVTTPRRVLKGASLVTDVVVSQTGFAGRTVTLNVEDEGRIVGTQEVTLPAGGEPATVRVQFTATDAGPRLFRFRIPPQDGEMVAQNNSREALIQVDDRREKILYLEGEPRFEVKFLRRAVDDDQNLQVVVLQRTAENKFMRLHIDEPDDLLGGFPKTREELFEFRGLILGSVEASFFTPDQLRMVADFVSQRGGGLLALGGRSAFAEGGYAGTPVADVLPVLLEDGGNEADYFAQVAVRPTRAGAVHAALQIGEDERSSAERWQSLPALSTVNPIYAAKPGATVLLTGRGENLSREQIVLAYQRFGAGKAMTFAVQDSWLWQMHAEIAVEDLTHEILWRRLLRWLVDGVPERVDATVSSDRVEPGEPVTLTTRVLDPTYLAVNNGRVTATVTTPSGNLVELPMEWTVERDGEYQASFTPDEEGFYEVHVEASRDDESLGADSAFIRAIPSDAEYFDATMRADLLQRVADETDGRFYTPETVSALPEDIRYTGGGMTVVEEKDLWDAPVLLMLLLGLLAAEWTLRRVRGLA